MEDSFLLTVSYKGQPLELETSFQRWGYTYRFRVLVEGMEVVFEPDEEGGFRAIVPDVEGKERRKPDPFLLQCIAETISENLQ